MPRLTWWREIRDESALCLLCSIPAERQHEILRRSRAGIPVAVQVVRRHERARARPEAPRLAIDGHFDLSFPNEQYLFVNVLVRRMRRHAGWKLALVQIQQVAGMRVTGQDLIRLDCWG